MAFFTFYCFLLLSNIINVIACPSECNCATSTICRGGNYSILPDSFPLNMESLQWDDLNLNLLDSSGPLAAGRIPGLHTLRFYNLVLIRVSQAPFQWLRLQVLVLQGCCFSGHDWPKLSMLGMPPSPDQLRIRVNMRCSNNTSFSLPKGALSLQVNQLDLADNCFESIDSMLWLDQKKLNVIRLDANILNTLDLRNWEPPSKKATLLLRNMPSLRVVHFSGQHFSKLDLSGTQVDNVHKLNCTLRELNLDQQRSLDFARLVKQFCAKLKKLTISHTHIINYTEDVFLRQCPPSAQLSVLTIDTVSGISSFPQLSHLSINQLDVVRCNLTDDMFNKNGTPSTLVADVVDLGGNLLTRPTFHFTSQVLDLSLAKNSLPHLLVDWLLDHVSNKIMEKLNFSYNPMADLFNIKYEANYSTRIKVKKLVLENLDSVKNQLSFPEKFFVTFSNVQDLYIGENNLKNLTSILNELCQFEYNVTLERLYLQKNHFVSLQKKDFFFFSKLIRLDVSGNRLSVIQKDAFLGLNRLLYLDLSDNQLLNLTVWLLSLPEKVHTLKVGRNPLSCACSANTTSRDTLFRATAFLVTDARCAEPPLTVGLNYFSSDSENVTLCGQIKESTIPKDSYTNQLLTKLLAVPCSIILLILLILVVRVIHKKTKSGFYKPVHLCICDVPKSTEILQHPLG